MKYIYIIVIQLFVINSLVCQTPYASLETEFRYDLEYIGESNILQGDFNSDGVVDFAYSSEESNYSFIRIVSRDENNKYKTVSLSKYFDSKLKWMEYDKTNNLIYCSFNNGEIIRFNPITWEEELILDIGNNSIYKFKIYELSGRMYYVLEVSGSIQIYDDSNQNIFSKSINSLRDFEIGNVDDDPAIEIIVNAKTSYVIDTESHETEWIYYGYMGEYFTIGDADKDGISYIFGTYEDEVVCYDAILKSPIWNIQLNVEISSISYHNSNNPNEDLLIIGYIFNTTGGIEAISAKDRTRKWKIDIPQKGVITSNLSNVSNDGIQDLFYICGKNTVSPLVVIRDLPSGKDWISINYSEKAYIDLSYSNINEFKTMIFCSESSTSGYTEGILNIFSGEENEIISNKIMPYKDITSISNIKYNGDHYYFIKNLSKEIIIYKNDFETEFIKYISPYSFRKMEVIQLNENAPPVIIALDYQGRFFIFNFVTGEVVEEWSTPIVNDPEINFIVGNYDIDESLEVAILYQKNVLIYDLSTRLLDNQIPILMENAQPGMAITDYDSDGSLDLVIGAQSNFESTTYQVIDIVSKIKKEYLLSEYESIIEEIKFSNLVFTGKEEMLIISDSLYIKDIQNDSILYMYPMSKLNFNQLKRYNIIVEDIDLDNHKDIFISQYNGINRFKIEQKYENNLQPFLVKFTPSDSSISKPSNQQIRFYFSEALDQLSLDDNITISDINGTLQAFEADWEDTDNSILITPNNEWTINSDIIIKFKKSIKDLEGNKLDGNQNYIEDDNDDITIVFHIGVGPDYAKPYFKELLPIPECLPSQLQVVSGILSDRLGVFHSDIESAHYSVDIKDNPKQNVLFKPIDGDWDSPEETFKVYIPTYNLSIGEHMIYFSGIDNMGFRSELDSIRFIIKEKNKGNWESYGDNLFNTSHNENCKLKPPFQIQYEVIGTDSHPLKGLTKSIVVNDYLVNCDSKTVFARDLISGDTIWTRSYDNNIDKLSAPCYENGNVYVQVVGHLSSSKLVCLSISDGLTLWETDYNVLSENPISPVVVDSIVLINEDSNITGITAYDALNGEKIWHTQFSTNSLNGWSPAVYDGKVYCLSNDFAVIDLKSGVLLKRILNIDLPYESNAHDVESPLIDTLNNQVILTNGNGLFALDLTTYELNWELSSFDYGKFKTAPSLHENSLFISTWDSFNEVDASNGTLIWSDENLGSVYDQVVSDEIICCSNYNSLIIYDRRTKDKLFSYPSNGSIILSEKNIILTNGTEHKMTVFTGGIVGTNQPKSKSNNLVTLYPNRTSGIINIEQYNRINETINMDIYNARMEILGKHNIISNSSNYDLSKYPSGLYFVQFSTKSHNEIHKVILVK